MVKKDFLVPIIEWVLNLFLFPFDVYIIAQKNFIGQQQSLYANFQEKEYRLTIRAGYGKIKIKIENEIPHSLKMKIADVPWMNFENENYRCSLREN